VGDEVADQLAANVAQSNEPATDGAGPAVLSIAARLALHLEAERDRWALWVPVIYGTGIAAYFQLTVEPGLVAALAPLVAALALYFVLRSGTLVVAAVGIVLTFTAGFAAAKLRALAVDAPVIERRVGLAEVTGWVELVEPRAGRGQRITLRVASIKGLAPGATPYRVRVRTMSALAGLKPGDAIRLKATLSPPAMPAVPGGYDFARSAWFQRLGGVGYALARPELAEGLPAPPLSLQADAVIARVRLAIGERVRAALPGERGAIAEALITGERGGISQATNDAYRDSGIFHILSISGLHMTVMAGAVFLALRLLLAAIPAIALRYPVKKIAAVLAVLAALGYLLISGGSFATVRSWVMISIMFLAVLLDRPAVALRNVSASALIIMLVLPESLLDIGFQMSFAAVVALVSAYEALRERQRTRDRDPRFGMVLAPLLFFGGIILTTLIASAAVAPFAAYHFHKSQQYAVLANLIAIPACNIIVMPAALGALVAMPFGLEVPALWAMAFGIDIMTWCAETVARLPGAVGRVPAIPDIAFALMVAGGLWLLLWRTRWRIAGLAGIAAGLALAPLLPRPDVLVGRDGDLVAVRTASGALSAIGARRAQFELSRWLERDGDARPAREAGSGQGFRCDAAGCVATVKGKVVAVSQRHSALAEDCARADILVMSLPQPRACRAKGTVVDLWDVRDKGTHAIYLGDGRTAVVSVADVRGLRPWSNNRRKPIVTRVTASSEARAAGGRRPAGEAAGLPEGPGGAATGKVTQAERKSRLGTFAAPFGLSETDPPAPRPEIEEDDERGGGR
jgi:competence protein ComEC